jgi:hypothetical protein
VQEEGGGGLLPPPHLATPTNAEGVISKMQRATIIIITTTGTEVMGPPIRPIIVLLMIVRTIETGEMAVMHRTIKTVDVITRRFRCRR